MGCGWTAQTDFSRVQAVEVINGGSLQFGADSPLQGMRFWEAKLNAGERLTAVGGSDNHDGPMAAGKPQAVGSPTTVVHAANLSQPAILDGIRKGRVFIDVEGTRDRVLDVAGESGRQRVSMGGALVAPKGQTVRLDIRVTNAQGGLAVLFSSPGQRITTSGIPLEADAVREAVMVSDGKPGWIRVDVRGPDGKLWLVGNPIYLNLR